MRPGYYKDENGNTVNGHWHDMSIQPGDFYQSRKTDQWFVVEEVMQMPGPDNHRWFCQIRPATQEELDARPKPNPTAEKKSLLDFFGSFDN